MLQHVGTKTIHTNRLILRRFQASDAQDIWNNWVTDPQACRFWTWDPHTDIEETKSALQEWIQAYQDATYYHWVIVLKENIQAVGYIYLNAFNEEQESAAIHFLLSRKHWNKGHMTEACQAVLAYAFTQIGASKVATHHHAQNPASGRIMQKSGMQCIGNEDKQYPECPRISGTYCLYEIRKEDWQSAQ